MLTLAVIALMIVVVFPVSRFSVIYLENYFPHLTEVPKDAKGLILLGGSFNLEASAIRQTPCYNCRAGRMIQFVELAQQYSHLPLIFTGGGVRSHPSMPSESDLAESLFKNLRLDMSRIRFEKQSRNTFENAKFTFNMINPKSTDHWILVTSALHMPRAVALFRSVGWNVIPCPVDYLTTGKHVYGPNFSLYEGFKFWRYSVNEWFGLLQIYIKGARENFLPSK